MTTLQQPPEVFGSGDFSLPRYDLTPEELVELEARLVTDVRQQFPEDGVYAALIQPNHEYANVLRAYEAGFFPEVQELSGEIEEDTLFLALVDTRQSSNRVVHAATISGFRLNEQETPKHPTNSDSESTGFIVVDDLIEMGNFTAQEFRDHYAERGINLRSCISVETNFRVGERVEKVNGIDTVDLAYLTIFGLFMKNSPAPEIGKAAVFASINRASLVSFGRVGLQYELLMGRDDLETSEARRGLDYKPVAIPYNGHASLLFASMGVLQPDEVNFSAVEAA